MKRQNQQGVAYIKGVRLSMLIFVALLLSSCAQIGTVVLNSQARTGDYTSVTNIVYGVHRKNKLDIYRPLRSQPQLGLHPQSVGATSNRNKKPVIVFFYGGCWGECNSLSKSDYLFVAQSFSSRGYITVIPDFREYPDVKFADIMSDASNVIRWISQHIVKYGGDPSRLILVGHSSGAHIASMLTLNTRYLDAGSRIRGFIGLAGPYDFLPLDEAYQRTLFGPSERYADSQPINFVSPQSPPLLILQGVKDTTVGKYNAVNLARKAQRLGVSQKLIIYPKHDHVGIMLALSRSHLKRSSVFQDMLGFINDQTK